MSAGSTFYDAVLKLPRIGDATSLSGTDLLSWGWIGCASIVLDVAAGSTAASASGVDTDSFAVAWASGVSQTYSASWSTLSAYPGMTVAMLMTVDTDASWVWHIEGQVMGAAAANEYDVIGLRTTASAVQCYARRGDASVFTVDLAPLLAPGAAESHVYVCVLDDNVLTAFLDGERQGDIATGSTFGSLPDYSIALAPNAAPRIVSGLYLFPSALSIRDVYKVTHAMLEDTRVAAPVPDVDCPESGVILSCSTDMLAVRLAD